MKKYIKILAPILLGFFFIYLTIKITTPEERVLIWSYIKSAKIEFVIAAMMFGAFADVIRGLRWRFLAKAVGHSSNPLVSIASVFMCYSSNLIITRSGELLRATVLSGYNNIPLGKTFGTIAAERVIDMMISLIILLLVWMLQYEIIVESFFDDQFLFFIDDNIHYIIGLGIIIITLLSIFFIKIKSVKTFFLSIVEGLLSIVKLKKDLPLFILATLTIWAGYFTAFYMIKFSITEFAIIPTELILPTFVVSVFSISLSNHGLGVYPLAISLFLLEFNINTEIGLAYGWLAWSCQAIITLFFGGLSFFVLPLFNSSD
ncbi:MAG: lysylphosphatidylglycerol synthase transmembrane domain-containing protein [Bacteroidota bacterium]|nr:lysylphosphatidylglycerol synthase transmembrane domain-containing protein [Bacteroidota bacterium]|tara:strand:+ start:3721 stop:4671 length:951 start_codon:yes stop_codon:yes gene_type:complete